MRKALILAVTLLVLGGGALFYAVRAARVAPAQEAAFDLAKPGQIVVRDHASGLVRGSRTRCERFATASGTGSAWSPRSPRPTPSWWTGP